MRVVAYFTAVIARTSSGWRARDIEVDDVASLEDLTDRCAPWPSATSRCSR